MRTENREIWIGNIHIEQRDIAAEKVNKYELLASVAARSGDDFTGQINSYYQDSGYRVIWIEQSCAIETYLSQYGHNAVAIGLAQRALQTGKLQLSEPNLLSSEEINSGEDYLLIEEIAGVAALPEPAWGSDPEQRPYCPEPLREPLFGQPEPSAVEIERYGGVENVPIMRTYAILDATLRRNITGVLDLDDSSWGIPIRCLFKNKAGDDYKNVAPYLVDLTIHESTDHRPYKAKQFAADFFSKHFDNNEGIFIRS